MDFAYAAEQRRRYHALAEADCVALVDLEATCTDDPALKADFRNEVIEVGLCVLRLRDGAVVDKQQWYTRPTTTEVNAFCTHLTGIEPATVACAPGFAETMDLVAAYLTANSALRHWGSFGEYDRRQLERQSLAEGCGNAMATLMHFNVKAFAQMALRSSKGLGLSKVVARLNLSFYGRHHSGVDDAVNVAHVLRAVRERCPTSLPL